MTARAPPGRRPPTSSTCSRTRWWRWTGTARRRSRIWRKSWTVSPDGKLYTFKLRDDVTFCSGKKFTAADVIYSFTRLTDPEFKAPLAWRAGNIKELRAPDPYTVEYELKEPFADLLLQLTMFTTAIHNKDSVESLGKDYGVQGHRRHRTVVFRELAAAHRDRAEAARCLQMGPLDVREQGPGEIREARHQDRAGGFQPGRGHDGRPVRRHPPDPARSSSSRSRPRRT